MSGYRDTGKISVTCGRPDSIFDTGQIGSQCIVSGNSENMDRELRKTRTEKHSGKGNRKNDHQKIIL